MRAAPDSLYFVRLPVQSPGEGLTGPQTPKQTVRSILCAPENRRIFFADADDGVPLAARFAGVGVASMATANGLRRADALRTANGVKTGPENMSGNTNYENKKTTNFNYIIPT